MAPYAAPHIAPFSEPRRYRLKPWVTTLYWLLALAGAAFATVPIYLAQTHAPSQNQTFVFPLTFLPVILVSALFSLFFGLSAIRQFVELDDRSISVGTFRGVRSLPLNAIKGRRTISTRNGSYTVLESIHPGTPRLTISSSFAFDDRWRAWIQTLPDLDELDRKAILDTIANDASLGTTPEERLQKLAQAKAIAIVLTVIAAALAGYLFFAGQSLSLNSYGAIDLLLVILPWIALILLALSPNLYSPIANKRDPRAPLMFVLLASGIGLIASPFPNVHSVSAPSLFPYACIPALLLAGALFTVATSPKSPGMIPILLIIGGLYGYGIIQQINTQLDSSPLRQYSSQVLRKTYSSGRSTTWYLYLTPWDPQTSVEKVSVSSTLYHSVHPGDSVCIAAHDGALHVGWYSVHSCNSPLIVR
jgi:hypothetical protein